MTTPPQSQQPYGQAPYAQPYGQQPYGQNPYPQAPSAPQAPYGQPQGGYAYPSSHRLRTDSLSLDTPRRPSNPSCKAVHPYHRRNPPSAVPPSRS
ncbi:hypothetical protein SAMN05216511_3546 [Streptomyces sp. KS_16]|nr:hypothetical protein SAMN05216511_3546 [Streptomyces sp. KS_16]